MQNEIEALQVAIIIIITDIRIQVDILLYYFYWSRFDSHKDLKEVERSCAHTESHLALRLLLLLHPV